jgi:hypothetical protein
MWEIILGAGLTIVVAVLAEKYEGWKKKALWIIFVLLVIALAIVQISGRAAERRQADSEKDAAEKRASKLEQDVKDTKAELEISLREQARMSGHLEGIQAIMENFSKSGIPGMKEFATAITKMNDNVTQQQNAGLLSNQETCRKAHDLTQRIRDFQAKFEEDRKLDEETKTEQLRDMQRQGKSREEMNKVWDQNSKQEIQRDDIHQSQFRNTFMIDGKYYKDLLFNALPKDKQAFFITQDNQAEHNLNAQSFVGANNEYGIAAYLDELANTVCPPPTPKQKIAHKTKQP